MEFTDEFIRSKYKRLPNHGAKELKEYLINRFEGVSNLSEALYRILNHILTDDDIPTCKHCGKKVTFDSFNRGYHIYCCNECLYSNTRTKEYKETCKKIYGVEYSLKSREAKRKTNLKKYGCISPFGNKKIQEKSKKTIQRKYGVDHISQNPDIQEKIRNTSLKKYGVSSWLNKDAPGYNKVIATNYNKYGVHSTLCNGTPTREKIAKTCQKVYGGKSPFCSMDIQIKCRETWIKRYGTDNPFASKEIINKIKTTWLNHYNVDNPFAAKEIQEKLKLTWMRHFGVDNPFKSPIVRKKSQQTCLERYNHISWQGSDIGRKTLSEILSSEEVRIKCDKTKRKNGSYGKSREEDEIYLIIYKKYPSVKRQYKNSKYPFNCDFYIPELDLYIEYNGYWSHGDEPFNPNNPNHLLRIILWESKRYLGSIDTWTRRDPIKRNIAKTNGLNYVELWNFKDAVKWIEENL